MSTSDSGNGADAEGNAVDITEQAHSEETDRVEPSGPTFTASFGADYELPTQLGSAAVALQKNLGIPVILLMTGALPIDRNLSEWFITQKHLLPRNSQIAVLIDSAGGDATAAYAIAELIRRHCGSFVAVVPRYAKSAATLLSLGAEDLILGSDAELGPLDVQIYDPQFEGRRSGLDEVQALDQLHAAALQAVMNCVYTWGRSGKKFDTLLPTACDFVANTMRPLFEKIDTVSYTGRSRLLRVAEEYAIRLLQPSYSEQDARAIARALVEQYPDHSFVIDANEARRIGLNIADPSEEQQGIFDVARPHLSGCFAIGAVKEVEHGESE